MHVVVLVVIVPMDEIIYISNQIVFKKLAYPSGLSCQFLLYHHVAARCVCVVNIYFWAQLFFELDKGVTCLCVQQQLVTRAYYIISRIINQFLLLVLFLSLLWSLGTASSQVTTQFSAHTCACFAFV